MKNKCKNTFQGGQQNGSKEKVFKIFKYEYILKNFKGYQDDRELAINTYNILLNMCDDMKNVKNVHIRTAVNKEIREQEKMLDGIIERFTGKFFDKENMKWEVKNND